MNFFDIIKEFCQSDLAKENTAVFIIILAIVFVVGGGIVYLYMRLIHSKQIENECRRLGIENKELERKCNNCNQEYIRLKKEYDELKALAEEADFKKEMRAYQASKEAMGDEFAEQFSRA